jgi:hypothetical protein
MVLTFPASASNDNRNSQSGEHKKGDAAGY